MSKLRENSDYLRMVSRIVKAAGRRCGNGDEHDLRDLVNIANDIQNAVAAAIAIQLQNGRSWSFIGHALGMTRQGAYQKYSHLLKGVHTAD
jgi:hypothetical protein